MFEPIDEAMLCGGCRLGGNQGVGGRRGSASVPAAIDARCNEIMTLPPLMTTELGTLTSHARYFSKTYRFIEAFRKPRKPRPKAKCSKLFNIIDNALDAMHATGGIDALIEVYGLSELYLILQILRAEGCDEMLIEEAFDRPSCTSLRTRGRQVLAELENSPLYNKLDSSQAMYVMYIATERAHVAQCFLEAPEGHNML